MKKLLLSSVAAVAMTGVASAADLPMKAIGPSAPVTAWSWQGLYIGVNGGFAGLRTETDFGDVAGFDGEQANSSPSKVNTNGGAIGGHIGYNWQFRRTVLGVEADGDFLFGLKKSIHHGYIDNDGGATTTSNATGFTSVRARVGFDVYDGTLLYVTGGVGWLHIKNNFSVDELSGGVPKGGNFTAEKWQPAFVVGGGIEQMITNNLSIRGEVLWAGTKTHSAAATDTHYFDTPTTRVNYNSDLVLARIGLSYKIW